MILTTISSELLTNPNFDEKNSVDIKYICVNKLKYIAFGPGEKSAIDWNVMQRCLYNVFLLPEKAAPKAFENGFGSDFDEFPSASATDLPKARWFTDTDPKTFFPGKCN